MKDSIGVVFFAIVAFIITTVQVFFGSLCTGAVLVALWQLFTIGPAAMTFGFFVLGVVKFAAWVTAIVMTIISGAFLIGKRIW